MESIYNLVSEKINIKNEFLYTGSYGSTLVKYKTFGMRFFKKIKVFLWVGIGLKYKI